MANRPNNHSREPATTADLNAMKTEIIDAVKGTVTGLATQDTVSAVMATVAETKEGVTELKGLMMDMMQELTATHEDVRYVRNTMNMLAVNYLTALAQPPENPYNFCPTFFLGA